MNDRIEEIDPLNWNDWELDPYPPNDRRPWGIPPQGETYLKSMAGYKTRLSYSASWYRDPVTNKMQSGLLKHMHDWKVYKETQ